MAPSALDRYSALFSPSNFARPRYITLPEISKVVSTVKIPIRLTYSEYMPNSDGERSLVNIGVNTKVSPREMKFDATDHNGELVFLLNFFRRAKNKITVLRFSLVFPRGLEK